MTKNFFYTVLLSVANLLFPLLSFPYASHVLGPEGIGAVQMSISFAQYFALFAALGIPIYGITEIARHRHHPENLSKAFSELSIIFFVASWVMFLIYLIIIYSIPFFQSHIRLYLQAGLLVLLSFTYTDWFFSGLEAFKSITLRSVLIKIISLVLLYICVKTKNDYEPYLLIVVFSILGNQLLSFILSLRITKLQFNQLHFKKHVKPLFFLFSTTLAASIYTMLDTVLLGFLADNHSVGLYTASIKLVKLTIPIVTAMGVILIPSITRLFEAGAQQKLQELLSSSFEFLIFFAIPVSVALALLAPECILVFSGNQFTGSIPVMQILSLLPILIGFGHFYCFQILLPAGKTQHIFYAVVGGVVVCLLLNLLLVPHWKSIGAAIANVTTECVVTGGYIYYMRRFFNPSLPWKYVLHSLAACITFFPIIYWIRLFHFFPVVTLLIAALLCSLTFFAIQWWLFRHQFLLNFIKPLQDWLVRKKKYMPDEY
ncbi:MAG: flippase [Chitinophagia bacterium]|jgi:O-antigen/teichoic acid export membrane protein